MLTTLPATYAEALDWLHGLGTYGIRLGTGRMAALLAELDHPEVGPGILHVTGTNGKGSTAAYLAAILQAAGYRVGLYTSPHLERFEERIQIGGEPVPPDLVLAGIRELLPAVERLCRRGSEPPTEFEAITALGWLIFRRAAVDLVVLEVGMGGRFDATNAIPPPLVSVITGVALDHTDRLGRTVEAIAWEKAGILKPGVPAVAAGPEAALAVIRQVAAEVGAPLFELGEAGAIRWTAGGVSADGGQFSLTTPWGALPHLHTALLGRHQLRNGAVAAAAMLAARAAAPRRLARVTEAAIRTGLATARWPGRLELCRRTPLVVLDGAHNPEGAGALAAAVRELFGPRRLHLVTALVRDKDAAGVLQPLLPVASRVYATQVNYPQRALPACELAALVRTLAPAAELQVWPAAAGALQAALAAAAPEDLVLVAGSLYLVGELRPLARQGGIDHVAATGPADHW